MIYLVGLIITVAGLILILSAVRAEKYRGHLGVYAGDVDPRGAFIIGVLFLAIGPPLVLILGVAASAK